MDKKICVAVWALGLALSNLLLFILEKEMTLTFWITFAFIWVSFLSSLVLQMYIAQKEQTPDEGFLHIPALTISLGYEIAQIPVSIIFALGAVVIPGRAALLMQGVLLIIVWAAVMLSLGGNEHIKKVNERQKDHHTEI